MRNPKKRKRRVAALVLGAAFVVILAVFLASPTPTHQGKTAEEWIGKLHSPKDYAEAVEAIQALQAIGEPAVPALLWARSDFYGDGLDTIDKALESIGEPAVEPLIRWLEKSTGRFPRWKRHLWFELPSWMRQRIRCPESESEAARLVYSLLASIGPSNEKAVESMLQGLEHKDSRYRALIYLPMMDRVYAEKIVPALIRFLSDPNDPNFLDCLLAVKALARFDDHAAPAVSRLIELLRYEDGSPYSRSLRMAAADALRNIGDDSAPVIDALRIGLKDEDVFCRAYCALALWQLGKDRKSALQVLEESLDASTDDLSNILYRLAWRLEADVKPPLEGCLESLLAHGDLSVRIYAAECLWKISQSPAQVMPVLLDALENGSDSEKGHAARQLAGMGEAGGEAVPLLIQTVKAQPRVNGLQIGRAKSSAIRALGKMGMAATDALPVLQKELSSPSAQAQILAYEAIESIRAAAESSALED